LGGGGLRDSVTKYQKGEGGGQPKCHVRFFFKKIDLFCLEKMLKT
jgi:hypothetical protein